MTLQEAKDQIAKDYSYSSWQGIDFYAVDVIEQTTKAPYSEERLNDQVAELYANSKISDFKASLREAIEKRIEELENDEAEFSDEEVFFGLRERKNFLSLIDSTLPKNT